MRSLGIRIALLAGFLLSCANAPLLPRNSLNFFAPAPSSDPWTHKVDNWQERHAADAAPDAKAGPNDGPTDLALAYSSFSQELRREVAADTVAWVQGQSRKHYRPDGESDHWATLGEVIRTGGDDCDGLDLLTFQTLRKLGFSGHEIFRAIVVEDGSGQHHMVTLWFEGGDRSDPFVLDPTGVVTSAMVRLSEVGDWQPIELFNESDHFRVETGFPATSVAER